MVTPKSPFIPYGTHLEGAEQKIKYFRQQTWTDTIIQLGSK